MGLVLFAGLLIVSFFMGGIAVGVIATEWYVRKYGELLPTERHRALERVYRRGVLSTSQGPRY